MGKSKTYPYFHIFLALSCNDVFVRKAMKDSFSEPFKVSITVSVAFQDFDFVVTSLGKTVGVWCIKRIQYARMPINKCF